MTLWSTKKSTDEMPTDDTHTMILLVHRIGPSLLGKAARVLARYGGNSLRSRKYGGVVCVGGA